MKIQIWLIVETTIYYHTIQNPKGGSLFPQMPHEDRCVHMSLCGVAASLLWGLRIMYVKCNCLAPSTTREALRAGVLLGSWRKEVQTQDRARYFRTVNVGTLTACSYNLTVPGMTLKPPLNNQKSRPCNTDLANAKPNSESRA